MWRKWFALSTERAINRAIPIGIGQDKSFHLFILSHSFIHVISIKSG